MNNVFLKKFLNEFEIYMGAVIFVIMTILLFVQVVTRYFFGHAVTWAEEISTIMFVWMIYLGVAAAVLRRKHLKIDAFVETLPFKYKKMLLILSNVIFLIFSLYIILVHFPKCTKAQFPVHKFSYDNAIHNCHHRSLRRSERTAVDPSQNNNRHKKRQLCIP